MYYSRLIDAHLKEWASRDNHKPVLLRGARQVGKSTAIRHLGDSFNTYIEINFEKQPEYKALFTQNLDVSRIVSQISALHGKMITAGSTLLFLDEIQMCPEAIMALRFFKEDMPDLHVIAAGSLLEFALAELPTYGVGRIHSMFMHPMTFDEFVTANGEQGLLTLRDMSTVHDPLPAPAHQRLIELLRTYMLIGGMPEVVDRWVKTHNYIQCQELQDDILISYEDDFPKYRKRVDPVLLRQTLRSVAVQATKKFVYSHVAGYKSADVKKALELLAMAGIVIPVTRTAANGLPLGSEADVSYQKFLLLDPGLMLRLLNMTVGDISAETSHILMSNDADLVNKGPMAELIVGLEINRYQTPNVRNDLYYWLRQAKNTQAEVDYITVISRCIIPVEVKSGTQGGMKSLWSFMREKNLSNAIRCSTENYGHFVYVDKEADGAMRHVAICPLYSLSSLQARPELFKD